MAALRSRFENDIAEAIKLAQSDPRRKTKGADVKSNGFDDEDRGGSEIVAVELEETADALPANSARWFVSRIIQSKTYTAAIITAVPVSVLAGVIEILFINPKDPPAFEVNPEWVIENNDIWKFLFWFDFGFILLFIFDVVLRAFSMGVRDYFMDFICTMDVTVSFLDVLGLYLVIYLEDTYGATGFISGLRVGRLFRVFIRAFRCGRFVTGYQHLRQKDVMTGPVAEQKYGARYYDSIETHSINRTYVEHR